MKDDVLKKKWYTAVFTGYTLKRQRSWTPKTIALFKNLYIRDGDYLTPRAWSNATKKLVGLGLEPGDKVMFQAVVKKHALSRKSSYKITHLSSAKKIGSNKKKSKSNKLEKVYQA